MNKIIFFKYSSLIRLNTLQYDVIIKDSNTPPKYVTTQEIITSPNAITTHDSNSYTNDVTFQANITSPNIHTNENSHTSKNDTELFVSLENKQLTY